MEYSTRQPELRSPDIDWEEFARDFNSRAFLEATLQRLDKLGTGILNAKILHDRDNYQATLLDYEYTKYKNSTSTPGYENKETELRQFFTNRRNIGTSPRQEPPAEDNTSEESSES